MCFLFILGTNRARGEGGSEGTPKDATPEAEGPAGQQGVWVSPVSLVPTHI